MIETFRAVIDYLRTVLRLKSAEELFIEQLPMQFPVAGFMVSLRAIPGEKNRANVAADSVRGDHPFTCSAPETTPAEVEKFMTFYLRTPVSPIMLLKGEFAEINISFAAWREMNGPRGKDGKLKDSMVCTGFMSANVRCAKPTKSPTGLCHHHSKPGAETIWNTEWFNTLAEEERQGDDASQSWEHTWRPVASQISHTAADRQIYYLLELGMKPGQLQGIDKKRASQLISGLVKERDSR